MITHIRIETRFIPCTFSLATHRFMIPLSFSAQLPFQRSPQRITIDTFRISSAELSLTFVCPRAEGESVSPSTVSPDALCPRYHLAVLPSYEIILTVGLIRFCLVYKISSFYFVCLREVKRYVTAMAVGRLKYAELTADFWRTVYSIRSSREQSFDC